MRQHPEVDGTEVTGAAANDKQVPDSVHVRNTIRQIECYPGGVHNTAGNGQVQGGFAETGDQI